MRIIRLLYAGLAVLGLLWAVHALLQLVVIHRGVL